MLTTAPLSPRPGCRGHPQMCPSRIGTNQIGQQLESLEGAGYISIRDNAQTYDNPNGALRHQAALGR